MKHEDLQIGNYYYYNGFEMEYVGHYGYNYLFRVKFIDDKIIQEIGSLQNIYSNKKEMMLAMYGETIGGEIKRLEEIRKDRKDYKQEVTIQLQKISKDLGDNAVINAVITGENVQVAGMIATKVKTWVDAYIEKFIKLP